MANSDDRYEMLPYRELCKLSWVVRLEQQLLSTAPQAPVDRSR